MIAPHLRREFRLRCLDLERQDAHGDDEVVTADVRDVEAVAAACRGVAAVVHLAAQPAEADFRTRLLPRNVDGTWALFGGAIRAGRPRIVFASTVQTVLGYAPERRVGPDDVARPSSVYACTKLFGEALARYHADTSGVGVACLRLGAVRDCDSPDLAPELGLVDVWLGSRDLASLVAAAVKSTAPFATVIAVSPPATTRFDTGNPFGWTPTERPSYG
jgi:uronate dehydrogenase